MRFLVQPSPQVLDRARPPVRAFLAFAALLLAGWVASRAAHGALSPGELARILEPGPGERLGPVALWEEVHQGAFLYGFLLLTVGSLLVVCPVRAGLRNGLVGAATAAALVDLLAPTSRSPGPASRGGRRSASPASASRWRRCCRRSRSPGSRSAGSRGSAVVDPRMARFSVPVAAFAAMVAVVMATGAILFARKVGFDGEHVRAFYLGSAATFAQPRSLAGLLEVAVPHLLAVPLLLFVTLHLVAFALGARRRPFSLLAGITWGCAAAGIGAGFAIRFAWPWLAPLKVAAFVGLEATMLAWLLLLAAALLPPGRQEHRPGGVTGSAAAPPRAAR